MAQPRKRFVQLWERQRRNGVRLPAAFYFIHDDGESEWRCFYGPVNRVRRSRVFIDHSAIYGFVSAKELLNNGVRLGARTDRAGSNRFIRCRIIDRIRRPPP